MGDETKETGTQINEVLDINKALNGMTGQHGELILKGINYINIPESKFSVSQLSKLVKGIIESYSEALKALQMEWYEFNDATNEFVIKDGKNVCKEGKTVRGLEDAINTLLKEDCGTVLKKLPKAILIKNHEVLPKHLEYLMPVLDGPEEQPKK